jgi:5-aminolevulinate synthase
MLQINSLLKFSAVCPFLGHSTTSSLRNAASTNILTTTAMKCPMMGPKLAQISYARTYASVAGTQEVEAIHKVSFSRSKINGIELTFQQKDIPFDPRGAPSGKCPHAKAARQAAAIAQREADAKMAASKPAASSHMAPGSFNYQSFYEVELEKKHQDK